MLKKSPEECQKYRDKLEQYLESRKKLRKRNSLIELRNENYWKRFILQYYLCSLGIIFTKQLYPVILINFADEKSTAVFLMEDKFFTIASIFVLPSIAILTLILLTALSRLLTVEGENEMIPSHNESIFKGLLNQIISNTLQQSFIFIPVLTYYIMQQKTRERLPEIMAISWIWNIGRALFITGYMIGFKTKLIILRMHGFFTGLSANVVVLAWAFNYPNFISNFILSQDGVGGTSFFQELTRKFYLLISP